MNNILLPKQLYSQKLQKDKLEYYNEETKLYFSSLNNLNKKSYILVDGPPYANNPLHLGHLLNNLSEEDKGILYKKGLELYPELKDLPEDMIVDTSIHIHNNTINIDIKKTE